MQTCMNIQTSTLPLIKEEHYAYKQPVPTRFGEVFIDPTRAIHFPNGLLGMPDRKLFFLTTLPGREENMFKILHSIEEPSLSFLVLPLPLDNILIEKTDIVDVCARLSIPLVELTLLTIATNHGHQQDPNTPALSINCRAPLFIDSQQRLGNQYILSSSRYAVQHPLS